MVLVSISGVLLRKIDKIMIGIYEYTELVGIYSIADRLGTLPNMILISSNMIFSSIISELFYKRELKILESLYITITKWLIVLTLPIAITIIIFSKVILNFFGQEFISGSSSLIILSITHLINAASGTNTLILSLSGHQKLSFYNNIAMIVLNIGMNSILIPKMGILGAAIATGASIMTVNIIRTVEVKYLVGIIPYNKKFFHIGINLSIIIFISLLFKSIWSHVVSATICVILNITISIFISYLFKDESDNFIFEKIKSRLTKP
jgi:O-antigen/teichoic acid export membrane protein